MTEMGRGKGKLGLTNKDRIQIVGRYIEVGNYCEVAREFGLTRQTITNSVTKFMKEHPDQFQQMTDAFLLRNKMMMIHQNAHTTKKALDKVDELLDDTESLKEAAMAYGILYDKGALMKGESTQNSAIVIKMAGDIEELSK